MTIAVTKGLGNIAQQLRDLGYNVVIYGEYNYPVDAIIYSGEGLAGLSVQNTLAPGAANTYGVLMLNSLNKTISQIDDALKRRTYTPIF